MLSQLSKDLTCIFNMVLKGGTEYNNVIQVGYTNSVPAVSQTFLHKTLECSRPSGKAKWYPDPLVKVPWSDKSCQRLAVRTHESLMMDFLLIKDRKPGVPTEVVQCFLYSGYRVTVRLCLLVKCSEIHIQS